MTIEQNVLPKDVDRIVKKPWNAPRIQILDINAAEGATAGPLCDKHGSLSASTGNDRCTPPKP